MANPEAKFSDLEIAERDHMKQLSLTLRALHKSLLEAEATVYAPNSRPLELLTQVTKDPRFAWLQPLSELIIGIDEQRTDKEPLTEGTAGGCLKLAKNLIIAGEEAECTMPARIVELIQQFPSVAVAYSESKKIMTAQN